MRIVLTLEYDGSNYCGWQHQPERCSVQDRLETALSRIARDDIRVITAGRTDTGVHARYQVVHFDTAVKRPPTAWVRGVNTFLPDDIAVIWSREIPDDFHARYSAVERHYQYILLNRSARPGCHHHKMGWFHEPLDLGKMREAALRLIGEHDFSAFRAAQCQAKSAVRKLIRLNIAQHGNIFVFDLAANAFLHHMVRNIIGCLVYIGKGRYPPDWMQSLLESRDRALAAPTFSPAGLYLTGIVYDEKWKLPQPGFGVGVADFLPPA